MALAAVLLKPAYKGLSDEDITQVIAENPYLQYFLGLHEYRYACPFDPSMMTRFRQRITPEMIAWVNDQIIGRKQAEEKGDDNQNDSDKDDTSPPEAGGDKALAAQGDEKEETENEGTLILDATCVPQNIRFPTDSSLLNEAREKTEEIIDILHEHGMTEGRKPRTYRKVARKQYNSFSKARKKSGKMIRKVVRQQLGYLKRNLGYIEEIVKKHPDCLKQVLSRYKARCLEVIRLLFTQQQEMFRKNTHRVEKRIVSISQPWVRPIIRGKQNAEVEFGAKIEMSVVDGYLRIEDLRWDAFNESTTLIDSVEAYR
ncbi:MAG: transposase, partial [Oscillospiraceae bacterium]|nr:transposase [Oscillospiraceae bacterium]